jgi:hypothetical protein
MADIQLGLFDMGPLDSEAIAERRRQQKAAEMEALLPNRLGPKAYNRYKQENDRFNAEYAQFKQGYQRPPHIQAIIDKMRADIRSSYKPHLAEEYAMLTIEPGATKRDIKNAYRRMARKLHPDRGGDPEAFKAMYAAYRKLLAIAKE